MRPCMIESSSRAPDAIRGVKGEETHIQLTRKEERACPESIVAVWCFLICLQDVNCDRILFVCVFLF